MKELRLKVDRVEEGIAVCYAHEGDGMTEVPLPNELCGSVKDGETIAVQYDGSTIVSVKLVKSDDPKSSERRARLDRLFGRK